MSEWRGVLASEWRQFRMLVRVSGGRLMDAAVASREIDAAQFVIWMLALVATPPLFYAMRMMGKYSFMWRRPDLVERAAIADRLFFIVYAMLAASLLAAMLWEALVPDRRDQEIVGVLPVRPRTLAAARLTAAVGVALAFSAAIAIPSGLIYMANVATAARSAHVLGWAPAVLVAHVLAMTVAGLFSFAALLALRALAIAFVGAEAARRAAVLLQLLTILLLVETLIFLPGVLYSLVDRRDLLAAGALRVPPLWFLGLYAWLGGPPAAAAPLPAVLAIGMTAGLLLLACATYVMPARWHARRALETPERSRTGRSIGLLLRAASPVLRTPVARAVFAFTITSLARSRRHAMTMASHVGAAIAVGAVSLMAAAARDRPLPVDAPADYLLTLPLVASFFLVVGLLSAFAVPTDLEANWIFRAAPPRSLASCVDALAVVLMSLAVLPVALAWAALAIWWWGWWAAAAAVLMHVTSGLALVQLALVGWRSIPFTRAHVPVSRTVRGDWLLGIVALYGFGFALADVQAAAIVSATAVLVYAAAGAAIAIAARAYRLTRRPALPLTFDAPAERSVEALSLSEAAS